MDIEFDSKKDVVNKEKHGLPLDFAAILFEGDYKEQPDERQAYGETRMIALGFIADRLCVCVYTWRDNVRRIISLRKANRREQDAYHQDKFPQGG